MTIQVSTLLFLVNIKNQINNCDYFPLLFDINVFFQQKSFQYIKPQKLEIILFR